MKVEIKVEVEKVYAFASAMDLVRKNFPEFALEIDRAIYDVEQNSLPGCDKPNCDCRMSFEEFHALSNRNAEETKQ